MPENRDSGGPAFPSERGNVRMEPCLAHHHGMTLRDYFAAHAPVEIPEWFKWENPVPQPKQPVQDMDLDDNLAKSIRWAAGEGYGEEDLDEGLRPHWPRVLAWKTYYAARAEWAQRRDGRKYVAWRYHYADLMLDARKL